MISGKLLKDQGSATLAAGRSIKARLYGSLSSTGKGHRTDRAILAGLLGQKPETCDPAVMDRLADESQTHTITIAEKDFVIGHADTVIWDRIEHDFPFSNTLVMQLVDQNGKVLVEREYYSTGGGFFSWKDQPQQKRGEPPYVYGSMTAFKALAEKHNKPLHAIMLENEMAVMGSDESSVNAHLDLVLDTMLDGVALGLQEDGLLPAPFEFHRKARHIHEQAQKMHGGDAFMQLVSSYALAVSEGNAAGRLAVTAPTLGSAGTMPALVKLMQGHLKLPREAMRKGLLAAALVGFLCKNNASVAGAEVGCQGEIGVASSMAAAMAAHGSGAPLPVTEVAATIAPGTPPGHVLRPGGRVRADSLHRTQRLWRDQSLQRLPYGEKRNHLTTLGRPGPGYHGHAANRQGPAPAFQGNGHRGFSA